MPDAWPAAFVFDLVLNFYTFKHVRLRSSRLFWFDELPVLNSHMYICISLDIICVSAFLLTAVVIHPHRSHCSFYLCPYLYIQLVHIGYFSLRFDLRCLVNVLYFVLFVFLLVLVNIIFATWYTSKYDSALNFAKF